MDSIEITVPAITADDIRSSRKILQHNASGKAGFY